MAVGVVKHKHTQWTSCESRMLQQLRLNTLFPPARCTTYPTCLHQQHHAFQHELAAVHVEILQVLLSLCLLQWCSAATALRHADHALFTGIQANKYSATSPEIAGMQYSSAVAFEEKHDCPLKRQQRLMSAAVKLCLPAGK